MSTVAGIILAGGRSRRMGRDKALLPFPGDNRSTFISHLAAVLSMFCDEALLVARDAQQAANYVLPGVAVVIDQVPEVGPLMGLYSGLRSIGATHALVVAVDMPFVQPELIAFLLSYPRDDALLVPVVDGVPQVLLAVYPRSLLPTIETCLRVGERGPRALLKAARVRYIEEVQLRQIDPQLRSFVNLNAPEDLITYE
jgi:molybdopterin-guanine dinucleotide biosynthesis protein A